MVRHTLRILVALSATLFLQSDSGVVAGGQQAARASVVAHELVKTTRSWNGDVLPAYPRGQPEITILRIHIPAGARLEAHRHPVINAGVLLSGQLTVVTEDGKTLHLKAGDPIVEVVNTWHHGFNPGTVAAEIVVVYAGVVDTPPTIVEPH